MHKQTLEFMPETHAAEIERLPFTAHLILWVSLVFLVTAIIWANFASIDEVAHAEGRVIPSSQIQVIQNLEGGILSEILVNEGAQVKKESQTLRLLAGKDLDSPALLQQAIKTATQRVVVKRPAHAQPLADKEPDLVVKTKSNRFDIYSITI